MTRTSLPETRTRPNEKQPVKTPQRKNETPPAHTGRKPRPTRRTKDTAALTQNHTSRTAPHATSITRRKAKTPLTGQSTANSLPVSLAGQHQAPPEDRHMKLLKNDSPVGTPASPTQQRTPMPSPTTSPAGQRYTPQESPEIRQRRPSQINSLSITSPRTSLAKHHQTLLATPEARQKRPRENDSPEGNPAPSARKRPPIPSPTRTTPAGQLPLQLATPDARNKKPREGDSPEGNPAPSARERPPVPSPRAQLPREPRTLPGSPTQATTTPQKTATTPTGIEEHSAPNSKASRTTRQNVHRKAGNGPDNQT